MNTAIASRPLGRSGMKVSPMALGGNVFGWTVREPDAFRLLDAWVDAGFTLVDTADVYSTWGPGHTGGESETVIGKWLRASGKRSRVVLATKVGKPMAPDRKGLSPAYIRSAVEDSLRRLQTDCIDLYQSHEDDTGTPLADTLGAYAELIRQGKVRAIGASNYSAARLAEALEVSAKHGLPRYESLQPLYNLYDRAAFEESLQALCRQHDIGVISFYALAAGFLTGKYRSKSDAEKSVRGSGTTAKYLNSRGLRILAALDTVARRHATRPGVVALAWLLTRPGITAPIASATSMEQLEDIFSATRLALQTPDLEELDRASAGTA